MQTANVEASIRQFPKPKARYGKMTQSLATFQVSVTFRHSLSLPFMRRSNHPHVQETHPSWSYISDISSPLSNGKSARHVSSASSVLHSEQNLHRIAAARQLEVLERIEEGRSPATEHTEDLLFLPNIIDESYIPISKRDE